jgi:fructose-1,6-bisphosphatase/inositol monophosphatase family enzyme
MIALRVFSTTLALAWVAIGRQAAYIADNVSPTSVHFTAGTILCQAAGLPVTNFRGDPLHTTPGLLASASPRPTPNYSPCWPRTCTSRRQAEISARFE